MDAEIVASSQVAADEIGERADAHLQAGAVGYHVSDCPADDLVLARAGAHRQFEQRHVVFDDRINLAHVDRGAGALNPGHSGVDLDDQASGGARDGTGVVVAETEAEIAVPVHWCDGHEERVDADVVDKQPRRLMERTRHVGDDLRFFSRPRLISLRSTPVMNMQ